MELKKMRTESIHIHIEGRDKQPVTLIQEHIHLEHLNLMIFTATAEEGAAALAAYLGGETASESDVPYTVETVIRNAGSTLSN